MLFVRLMITSGYRLSSTPTTSNAKDAAGYSKNKTQKRQVNDGVANSGTAR
jgi:hypothetical protein